MSGQPSTVSDCVTAVCSAYHEACTLIQQINVEKKTCSLSAQELEASLIRGQSAIGAQYERIQKRLGESAANSDRMSAPFFNIMALASRLIHRSCSRRCPEGHLCPPAGAGGSQSEDALAAG